MRTLLNRLQTHLDTRSTTIAYCWRILRTDGTTLGFTEHDEDISFGGVTHKASSGFTPTARQYSSDMSVDNLDVAGYLDSNAITEQDIANGLYDNATVEVYFVNWQDVSERYLVQKGTIGNVSRDRLGFVAEVRGLSDELQKVSGRIYSRTCDAEFGDSRCGVSKASYTETGTIVTTDGKHSFTTTDLSSYDSGYFSNGIITFTSGDNNNAIREVKTDISTSGIRQISLWEPLNFSMASSDTFSIVAGCNKSFETCRVKFNNLVNFRGFPHIPPKDEVFKVSLSTDTEDYNGQSLFS